MIHFWKVSNFPKVPETSVIKPLPECEGFLYLCNIMRDVSDAMLVAIFSLLSLKLLEGWIAIITGLVAIPYIIVRLILALKRNNREKEQEKRNREKHEMEVRLLQKQLDGEM